MIAKTEFVLHFPLRVDFIWISSQLDDLQDKHNPQSMSSISKTYTPCIQTFERSIKI